MGLLSSLPAPKREYAAPEPAAAPQPAPGPAGPRITREAPPYGSQERNHYIPRRPSDFGDGGAFPEVQQPFWACMICAICGSGSPPTVACLLPACLQYAACRQSSSSGFSRAAGCTQ